MIMSSVSEDNVTSSFLIWTPVISLSCLTALAGTSSTMLNRSGKSGHLCLLPHLEGKASNLSPYDVSCGFAVYDLYYVEVYSFYTQSAESFYHERMFCFVKCFSCIH